MNAYMPGHPSELACRPKPKLFYKCGSSGENTCIKSFNGRLRDECLNIHVFFTLDDVWEKLARWQEDDDRLLR